MESNLLILAIIVFVAVLVIALFAFSAYQARKRTQALQQLAIEMGYQFQDDDPALLDQVRQSGFQLFRRGHSRKVLNILRRQYRESTMTIFDYRYTTSCGEHSQTHRQTVVLFTPGQGVLPEFTLRLRGFLDNLVARAGISDINFENSPEFSRKYHLSGSDEQAIRRVFNNAVLAFFESRRRFVVEASHDHLLIYRYDMPVKPEDLRDAADEARQIYDLLCAGA
jgi:hypothetical protein